MISKAKCHVLGVRQYEVTSQYIVVPASAANADNGKSIYGDSAYSIQEQLEMIRNKEALPRINEKSYRNRQLIKTQMNRYHRLSKTGSRVDHVFGCMTMSMGVMVVRCVGYTRAKAVITLKNLAYNMRR